MFIPPADGDEPQEYWVSREIDWRQASRSVRAASWLAVETGDKLTCDIETGGMSTVPRSTFVRTPVNEPFDWLDLRGCRSDCVQSVRTRAGLNMYSSENYGSRTRGGSTSGWLVRPTELSSVRESAMMMGICRRATLGLKLSDLSEHQCTNQAPDNKSILTRPLWRLVPFPTNRSSTRPRTAKKSTKPLGTMCSEHVYQLPFSSCSG